MFTAKDLLISITIVLDVFLKMDDLVHVENHRPSKIFRRHKMKDVRRSVSLEPDVTSSVLQSDPVDVPWPEKCAWHRTGSLKSHFVHLSDTLATDDIPLTG